MKILEAWEWYEKDKKLLNFSPYTLKSYKIHTNLLAREFENCDIGDLTYLDLKGYLYKQTHLKVSSLIARVRFMRSFFRWAVDEGHINTNPAAKIKEPKADKNLPKFLTEEETETLRANCESKIEHAIIEFMYTTGCRVGEIVKLNRGDINWDNGSVIVDGKGGFEREVYFNTKCKIWLEKYLSSRNDQESPLFATQRKYDGKHRRLSVSQLRGILKRVAKRAGLDGSVYPHRLRHSYATHMLNNGASMDIIRHMLGHQKQESTEIYAHLSNQRKKEMYKRFFSN